MSERVGMVGIGLMGQAMSANLLQAGFAVQGFDIDGRRMDELLERGGQAVDTPAAAARGVRWLLTSLPSSDVVREVALGPSGVNEGAEDGLFFVDTTTSRPEDSETIAAELAPRGVRFLDAGVSGTAAMAWEKDLVVISGGRPEDFEACRPLFEGFSRAAYHMGPVGSGTRTKLIINLVLAANRFGLAEGLTLGMKAGMDLEKLLTVLKDGACSSKTMNDKGPMMIHGDYPRQGSVRNVLKDSRLMLEQGQRFGSPMMMTSVWSQIQQTANQKGFGEREGTCFIEVLRGMAGLPER
ncbi:NAD(P)-dependent oxidoreductase [Nitrospinota bacterium]